MARIKEKGRDRLYKTQREWFEKVYQYGDLPWSDGKPTKEIVSYFRTIRKNISMGLAFDLGCGDGRHSLYIAERGFKTIGLDYQWLALLSALKAMKERKIKKGLLYVQGDIFQSPLKKGMFDLILDYGLFHHVRRRDSGYYIGLVRSLLKGDGYFILSCFSPHFRHEGEKRRKRNYKVHRGHYDRFSTLKELKGLFKEDFNILRVKEDKEGLYHLLMKKKSPYLFLQQE